MIPYIVLIIICFAFVLLKNDFKKLLDNINLPSKIAVVVLLICIIIIIGFNDLYIPEPL